MKFILTSSIIAMISAGIYGTADFTHDLKTGNYIVYDREDNPVEKQSTAAGKKVIESIHGKEIEYETNGPDESVLNVADLKLEDFSRGEPIYDDITKTVSTDEDTSAKIINDIDSVDAVSSIALDENKKLVEKK